MMTTSDVLKSRRGKLAVLAVVTTVAILVASLVFVDTAPAMVTEAEGEDSLESLQIDLDKLDEMQEEALLEQIQEDLEEVAAELARQDSMSSRDGTSESRNAPVVEAPPVVEPQSVAPAGSPRTWTPENVAVLIGHASAYYNVDCGGCEWLVDKGIGIIQRESGFYSYASNGQYRGLFQFGNHWGPKPCVDCTPENVYGCTYESDWRNCGSHAIYRFVKTYAEGGSGKIYDHWAATIH